MSSLATQDLRTKDSQHHLHPFTNHRALRDSGVRIIDRGEGPYLWDTDGNKILDGMAGLWTNGVGYGRKELADVAHAQMMRLPFYNTFFQTSHPPVIELAGKLSAIAPNGLKQVFFGSSGSDANDTAIRLIRHYWQLKGEPQRGIIISRRNAYHGSTVAAASMGGFNFMHRQMYPVYDGFRHILEPYWYGNSGPGETPDAFGLRAAKALEDEILAVGPENVAAFVAEPVQGAGGLKIPPATYWPAVQKIVSKYGILLLADEVITGFGRLGTWFASQYYGLKPDLLTFAKSVTSGYIPLSGLFVSDQIVDALLGHDDDFYHGYTFAGHPVACAVACKTLDIIRDERLVERVAEINGPRLQRMLASFVSHPLVGEVRSIGMLGAIEIVADKSKRTRFAGDGRVGTICRNHSVSQGYMMRAVGDTMVMAPPLVFTDEHFAEAETKIRKALDLTLSDVAGELDRRE